MFKFFVTFSINILWIDGDFWGSKVPVSLKRRLVNLCPISRDFWDSKIEIPVSLRIEIQKTSLMLFCAILVSRKRDLLIYRSLLITKPELLRSPYLINRDFLIPKVVVSMWRLSLCENGNCWSLCMLKSGMKWLPRIRLFESMYKKLVCYRNGMNSN